MTLPLLHVMEHKITKTLMAVVITFIICQMPGAIYPILRRVLDNKDQSCGTFFYYFYLISDGLSILNSTINFMIYMLCSAEFQRGFARLCCQLPRRHRSSFTSTSMLKKLTMTTSYQVHAGTRMYMTNGYTPCASTPV